MIVINAVTSHAAISNAGDPSPRDISAETIKMPDPIIEPITIAVAENSPIPCTNCGAVDTDPASPSMATPVSPDMSILLSSRSEAEGSAVVLFKKFTFRKFYRKISRKSLTTFSTVSPSTNSAPITATESAPASITLRAFARVIPPIATIGFFVSARARRTPSNPISKQYQISPVIHDQPATAPNHHLTNQHRISQHLLRPTRFVPVLQQLHLSRSQFFRKP